MFFERLNPFGAMNSRLEKEESVVYQIPARPISKNLEEETSMFLPYQSGYFQPKTQLVILRFRHSLSGDSPLSKRQLLMVLLCVLKRARSPSKCSFSILSMLISFTADNDKQSKEKNEEKCLRLFRMSFGKEEIGQNVDA